MSGIIPSGIMTVMVPLLDSEYADQVPVVRFPVRVKITSISFTLTSAVLGDEDAAGIWYLQASKYRRPRPDAGNDYPYNYSHGYNIWTGMDPLAAPHLDTVNLGSSSPISTIVGVPDSALWDATAPGEDPYTGDVAQMDPDEWLEFYVDRQGGRPVTSGWKLGSALIVISYEGATNID